MLLGMYRYENADPVGNWVIRLDDIDADKSAPFMVKAVALCKIKGILCGIASEFCPFTRTEAAQVVARPFDAQQYCIVPSDD